MSNKKNMLRGRIIERYGSQKAFAEAVAETPQSISAKLNGRAEFTEGAVRRWSSALGIETGDIGEFFYASDIQTVKV